MFKRHKFPIINYSVFFTTEQKGKEIQTHICCISSKSWSFFQSRMWQLRCAAFKQQIFLTIKGKFLNKSLLSWKGRLFFLIPPSVWKQQQSVLRACPWCRGTSSHQLRLPKRCAGKMPFPTHQLLVQCTLTLLKSQAHLVLSFQECFSRQLYWRVLAVVSFFFFKETSLGVF